MSLSILLIIAFFGIVLSLISPSFGDIIVFGRIFGRKRSIRISLKQLGTGINTMVGVMSLLIAMEALKDSRESGVQQQAILEKTKAAIDSSTVALQAVLETSKDQQKISGGILTTTDKQLDLLKNQWEDQQSRLAQKPKFQVLYKYKFFTVKLTGNRKVDSIISLPHGGDSISITADNDDYIEPTKNPFYDLYKDFYKYEGENTPEGYIQSTRLMYADQPNKKAYPIPLSVTRQSEYDHRYFYLSLFVENIGDLNAEKLYVTVTSLRRGLSLQGSGINAKEPTKEISGSTIYSPSTIDFPQLTIFQATKEQINLTLKVSFRDGLIGQEMPFKVDVFDKNVKNIPRIIRFKIVPK